MKSIVRLSLFVLVLFALAASTHAQNCPNSNPQMYQSPNPGAVSPPNPPLPVCSTTSLLFPATVLYSQTNSTTDYCSNLSYASIVTGYGVAHCTPYILYCVPEFTLQVPLATSTSDCTRFYNRT